MRPTFIGWVCLCCHTFDGSTIWFGVSQVRTKFDWNLELEAPVLLNLPSNSVAAGVQ
jgi:hypothetical protein